MLFLMHKDQTLLYVGCLGLTSEDFNLVDLTCDVSMGVYKISCTLFPWLANGEAGYRRNILIENLLR